MKAQYNEALKVLLKNEGGYVFDPNDRGGETYKGIARNFFPKWTGWTIIDQAKKEKSFPKNLEENSFLQDIVANFYKSEFWDKIKGDEIFGQLTAISIFDFAVNAGVGTSVKLVQEVLQVPIDGQLGPNTLKQLNNINEEYFLACFALAKINRYIEIIERRPSNQKYLLGWIRRTLRH